MKPFKAPNPYVRQPKADGTLEFVNTDFSFGKNDDARVYQAKPPVRGTYSEVAIVVETVHSGEAAGAKTTTIYPMTKDGRIGDEILARSYGEKREELAEKIGYQITSDKQDPKRAPTRPNAISGRVASATARAG